MELLQGSADSGALREPQPLPDCRGSRSQAELVAALLLQCPGGISALIYSCTPREPHIPSGNIRALRGLGMVVAIPSSRRWMDVAPKKSLQGCDTGSPHLPLLLEQERNNVAPALQKAWRSFYLVQL